MDKFKRHSRLRPLLPLTRGENSDELTQSDRALSSPAVTPRRSAIKVACEQCRKKKIKCDGERPLCGPCFRQSDSCVFVATEEETASQGLKNRLAIIQRENFRLRDLLGNIRAKPENEAQEILSLIRASENPLDVLDSIREADLSLPRLSSSVHVRDQELAELDREALENSLIKVPSHPWTTVAGNGIVSELISDYFTWDGAYFCPFVDRDTFVREMRMGDPSKARWCSPLLVNSICAHQSQSLERAKIYGTMTQQNLVERFLDEAQGLLRLEEGRASIPTAQALMLRYFTQACMGKDRMERSCRQNAVDMVHRLDLEAEYASITESSQAESLEKSLISKALWGLFLMETRIAFFYFQASQIPPPGIPSAFKEDEHGSAALGGSRTIDVLGRPFEESSSEVPLLSGILGPACAVSELFFEVMTHNTKLETAWGSESDVYIKKRFYARLRHIEESLPDSFLPDYTSSPLTCYLRVHFNEARFAILQTLRPETLFETPASQPGTTVKDLWLYHSSSDIKTVELFLSRWPFQACLWRQLYMSLQLLVLLLDDSQSHHVFITAFSIMRRGASTYRICAYLLQAVQALAWAVHMEIPENALPFLKGLNNDKTIQKLPVSFAMPQLDDIGHLLEGMVTWRKRPFSEKDLGLLVESWSLR